LIRAWDEYIAANQYPVHVDEVILGWFHGFWIYDFRFEVWAMRTGRSF
jgi:hypothetical protein